MAQMWEIVGGYGFLAGIPVRRHGDLTREDQLLSTGALVEEVELMNRFLRYRLVEGTGPKEGWVFIRTTSGLRVALKTDKKPKATPNMRRDSLKDLSCSFRELLDSQAFADVTLKIGGEEIRAHSQVLAARCTVFRTMLSAGMRESHSKEIEVVDLDIVAMKELLVFLYTGDFAKERLESDDFVLSLLEAAHQYEIAALIDECTAALGGRLAVENVSEMLKVADLIGSESLKEACLQYMCGRLWEVKSTPSYKSLVQQRPALLAELVEMLAEPPLKRARPDRRPPA